MGRMSRYLAAPIAAAAIWACASGPIVNGTRPSPAFGKRAVLVSGV